MFHVGDAEKFPKSLSFEGLDPFLRASKQGPCFTAIEEDGGDKRLVEIYKGWFALYREDSVALST